MSETRPARVVETAADGQHILLQLYERMLLIRMFEDRVYLLFLEGILPGTIHQSQGQEAVPVGACADLSDTDWITSTHRPHGHALAKGVTPRAAMAELLGKVTGCCRGKGGSMHLGDPAIGMIPALAIVGAGNSVVSGLGLAFKLRGTTQVAVCFFGEGASNEGAVHESMNFCAVKRLPVVFVCENNLYGASTPYGSASLVEDVASRASAYGMVGHVVDGMDVLAVRDAMSRAIARARTGEGPELVECKTYRFVGHSRGDARGYRSRDEEEAWKKLDPILRLRQRLVSEFSTPPSVFEAIEAAVTAQLEDAVAFAEASPAPDPSEAFEHVLA